MIIMRMIKFFKFNKQKKDKKNSLKNKLQIYKKMLHFMQDILKNIQSQMIQQ